VVAGYVVTAAVVYGLVEIAAGKDVIVVAPGKVAVVANVVAGMVETVEV
jgi:hypothetical protein